MFFYTKNIVQEFSKRVLAQTVISNFILNNLKPRFGRLPYQIESFQRSILYHTEYF